MAFLVPNGPADTVTLELIGWFRSATEAIHLREIGIRVFGMCCFFRWGEQITFFTRLCDARVTLASAAEAKEGLPDLSYRKTLNLNTFLRPDYYAYLQRQVG